MKTQKQIIGDLGEGISCNYLKNKGFRVIERNYWKPWGEIDIIAQKRGMLHFIEVKTVTNHLPENNSDKSRIYAERTQKNAEIRDNVTRETRDSVSYETLKRLKVRVWDVIRETIFKWFFVRNNVIHETNQLFLQKPVNYLKLGDGSKKVLNTEQKTQNVIHETVSFVETKETTEGRGTNMEKCGKTDVSIKEEKFKENDQYCPEDNIHPWKLKRLSRVIQSYLLNKNISEDQDWQFDVIIVYLNIKDKTAKVKYLENIVL